MCDGQREEISWTIQVRSTGLRLQTADGLTFVFDEEDAAREFVNSRPDAPALEVARVSGPSLD